MSSMTKHYQYLMRTIWSSRVTLNILYISVNTYIQNIVKTNTLGAYWVRISTMVLSIMTTAKYPKIIGFHSKRP